MRMGEETMRRNYVKIFICLLAFVLAGTFYCLKCGAEEELVWSDEADSTTAGQKQQPENTDGVGNESLQTEQQEHETKKKIYVHICGEVKLPGVYEVEEGCRLYELLELAGGATEQGMPDAMNLADVLSDGQRIVIPSQEEASVLVQQEQEEAQGLININTASVQQLMTLPGIGEAKAADIIEYRETNGSFQDITDIMKISGIKDALFQKIKGLITV